jgi:hypothetical protein
MKQILIFVVIAIAVYVFLQKYYGKISPVTATRVELNYDDEIQKIASQKDLPAEYFKALIALECSGEKPAKSRFEKHIFVQLNKLKNGKIKKFGKLTPKSLENVSENDLRALATSWGPLQIMGYHAFEEGKSVYSLKDDLRFAVEWCDKTYGYYLLKRDFKNAFHLHNTGQLHPKWGFAKTHDPFYVQKGLSYVAYFSGAVGN